ncbi:F-box domain-containing protein [Favolaschia claudopus]|uniref:F-box domain-containing protein n=1 Tax=Favolaschia claudopus TaxID=2862362 RepID=A0AAW0A2R8_9AGAR
MSHISLVTELRFQLDQLSGQIDVQKQRLRDLEQQRSDTRSRLNAILDPMARLPLEIQSQIFLCVGWTSHKPMVDPNDTPMIFLNVCHLWRVIALSTPRLWAAICMDSYPRKANTVGYNQLCKSWLQRARNLPLSLGLDGCLKFRANVQALVTEYQDRLQSLTLNVASALGRLIRMRGPFPALRNLTFRSDASLYLDTSPEISHFSIYNLFREADIELLDIPLLTLAHLEDLQVGNPDFSTSPVMDDNSASLLQYLCLPALKNLSLTVLDIPDEEMVSFFARSSPPLESLTVALDVLWPTSLVERCLRLIPTLTSLKLSVVFAGDINDMFRSFFEILGSPSLLPQLRRITLWAGRRTKINYEELLSMLRTRRTTPLESFELVFLPDFGVAESPRVFSAQPNTEVKAALRQLVTDGVRVHVGPAGDNLL